MREAPGQSRCEEAPEPPDHPAFLAMAGWTEAKGSQGRHDRQRDERGSRQRDHDGRGHRLEHLPFDAFEGEDRDIDQRDDGDAEEHRTSDLAGGGGKFVDPLLLGQRTPQGTDAVVHPAQEVLHHHDRPIDDQAEVDRPEAHEVRAGLGRGHPGQQKQEGKRDRQGDQQGRAPVPEQQQEHGDDDRCALEEVGLDRADGRADEVGAVVQHADPDAFRQVLTDEAQLFDRTTGDFPGVLTGQHDGGPDDGLVPIDGGGPHARSAADRDFGHIANRHGRA